MANATIRVMFGSASGGAPTGHLSAEIDARPGGLNGGKTSFNPGETAYLLVYKSSNVVITGVWCSAGSIAPHGSTTVTVTEDVMFEDADRATLHKPVKNALASVEWIGRSLGNLTLGADKMTVTADTSGIAVSRVSYEVDALVYALTAPASINGKTDFSILALIKGVAS